MTTCYVCARAASQDPKGEMDAGTMYLRGLLHGLNLSRPEMALEKLLHGGVLCDMHQKRADAIVAAMALAQSREEGVKS